MEPPKRKRGNHLIVGHVRSVVFSALSNFLISKFTYGVRKHYLCRGLTLNPTFIVGSLGEAHYSGISVVHSTNRRVETSFLNP